MGKSLVSIVTPCFNTSGYIHRLLDSVLQQTYQNIEMFIIDDGSTDNSADVVNSYMHRFQAKGYTLTLFSQVNSGQSVAIKEGLKLITGKYLVWPDSDDFYATHDAIERMVEAFEQRSDEYGLIRTQENLLEDKTFKLIGCNGANAKEDYDKRQLFEDCLYGQNGFYFCPGAYMADLQKLKGTTTLEIYTDKNAGQNWQLMLPLLYNYKCYTIKEPLYNVVVRLSSHSRGQYCGYEKTIMRIDSYEQTIHETLKRINSLPDEDRKMYSLNIKKKYCKERILMSFEYHKKQQFDKYYLEAISLGCVGVKEKFMKCFFNTPLVVKGVFYLKRRLKR